MKAGLSIQISEPIFPLHFFNLHTLFSLVFAFVVQNKGFFIVRSPTAVSKGIDNRADA